MLAHDNTTDSNNSNTGSNNSCPFLLMNFRVGSVCSLLSLGFRLRSLVLERHDPETHLVAEWIHFTLFGIILPTIKLKVYTSGGLMNSATKALDVQYRVLNL